MFQSNAAAAAAAAASMGVGVGVYRPRSYDNLKNGKSQQKQQQQQQQQQSQKCALQALLQQQQQQQALLPPPLTSTSSTSIITATTSTSTTTTLTQQQQQQILHKNLKAQQQYYQQQQQQHSTISDQISDLMVTPKSRLPPVHSSPASSTYRLLQLQKRSMHLPISPSYDHQMHRHSPLPLLHAATQHRQQQQQQQQQHHHITLPPRIRHQTGGKATSSLSTPTTAAETTTTTAALTTTTKSTLLAKSPAASMAALSINMSVTPTSIRKLSQQTTKHQKAKRPSTLQLGSTTTLTTIAPQVPGAAAAEYKYYSPSRHPESTMMRNFPNYKQRGVRRQSTQSIESQKVNILGYQPLPMRQRYKHQEVLFELKSPTNRLTIRECDFGGGGEPCDDDQSIKDSQIFRVSKRNLYMNHRSPWKERDRYSNLYEYSFNIDLNSIIEDAAGSDSS